MISIIGAGPTGNYLAYLLAKKNYEVQVFEEHKEIGSPVQCTGIITHELQDFVPVDKSFLINKINRAKIYSPNGNSILVKFKKSDFVIDRIKFDQYLAELAKSHGAKYHLGSKYESNDDKQIIVNGVRIKTDKIIGADGPFSKVAKNNGLWCDRKFVTGHQFTVKTKCEKDLVEFWLGIGMFGWLVPVDENTARIGVVAHKNPTTHLNKLISKRCPNAKIISQETGLIPIFNPKQILQRGNVSIVGDAATQVKATSFGGIIHGLKAAKLLSENYTKYPELCKKQVNRDLYVSLLIRRALDKFSAKDYNDLIVLCSNPKVKKILETKSRDYPTKFAFGIILAQPRLLKFLFKLI
ncbi:NAD(P)/FAD-dependent oxidoreductase [Candidatus Woesearchaeota archaeon]|nr:NAD(P)/FAD-dependent oxidoreductase [Candidatus Woesearchaeota archaeon]